MHNTMRIRQSVLPKVF